MTKDQVSAEDLIELIEQKFSGDEWAVFRSVPATTGRGSAVRRADVVAQNLWPSRGLELLGFEVKVQRSDWLRELKQPEKAEQVCRYCDRWWIVADKDVVQDWELPPTWGLMVKAGRQLRVKVKAPKIQAAPLDRGFVAVLLRRAKEWDQSPKEFKAAVDAAYEEGRQCERELAGHWKQDKERLEKRIKDFEKASGIGLLWDGAGIGHAVNLVLNQAGRVRGEGTQLLRTLDRTREALAAGLAELEALEEAKRRKEGTGS